MIDYSEHFYGDERVRALVSLLTEIWQSGVPDRISRVLIVDWNERHCLPPVDLHAMRHIPLLNDTLFGDVEYIEQ